MRYCTDGDFNLIDFPDYHGQDPDDFIKNQLKLYSDEYNKAKKLLSKKAVRILEANDFFHDWLIESVTYTNSYQKSKDKLMFSLIKPNCSSKSADRYYIEFYAVSDFTSAARNSTNSMIWGIEEFYRVEILPNKKNRISFELITSERSSVYFTCRGIILYKHRKESTTRNFEM